MSLQTGTELALLAMLFNKVTGLYGLLAIVAGYSLSALQLSMYLYSVLALAVLALTLRHVRRAQSPLENLVLAWLYTLDTAVDAAYTTVFAVLWYTTTVAQPGGGRADGVAVAGDAAVEGGQPAAATAAAARAVEGVHESGASMVLIVSFAVSRVYLALVVMAHARQVLRRYAAGGRAGGWSGEDDGAVDKEAAAAARGNPFAPGMPDGEGWRGSLGRALVSVGRGYWLGRRGDDDEWTRDVSSKIRSHRRSGSGSGPGPRSEAV